MHNKGVFILANVRVLTVDAEHQDQRLDNYLLRILKGVPRSLIYRIIRKGEVRINKKRCKPEQRLQEGDLVRIPPLNVTTSAVTETLPSERLKKLLKSCILFEDPGLLIINKPAGLAVHGGSGVNLGVIEVFRQIYPETKLLELVHRLDRDTSGCLMIAKKSSVLRELHHLLRENQIKKTYLALLKGHWRGNQSRRVTVSLRKNVLSSGERMVRVDPEGKSAATTFVPIKRFPNATLVEIYLETGRTHQIRVHAQYIKHPIIGDKKYGDERANKTFQELGCKRLMLHAASLRFTLPSQKKVIEITAPTEPLWDRALTALSENEDADRKST